MDIISFHPKLAMEEEFTKEKQEQESNQPFFIMLKSLLLLLLFFNDKAIINRLTACVKVMITEIIYIPLRA
jgi:hypothetical protein